MINGIKTEGYLKTADAGTCHTQVLILAMEHVLSQPLPKDPQYIQALSKRLARDLETVTANIRICDECLVATFNSLKEIPSDILKIRLTKEYSKIAKKNRNLEILFHDVKDKLEKLVVNNIYINHPLTVKEFNHGNL